MIVIFKDKQIISEAKDFESLTYQIENQFGRDLPTIYKIFFQDIGDDKIVITNDESFQQALKYAKDQGSQILLIVDDDILPDDLDIVLKRQISTEQSKIFAQSQHEQQCPTQFLQESLYNVDNAQLNIQQIFDYYSKIIARFRNQFIQLPPENRQQNYLIFYNQYQSLIQRMNEKLTGYFVEDISKLVNNPQIPVDTTAFFKQNQPIKTEAKQQEPDPEQIAVKPEKKKAKKNIQDEPKEPKELQQSQTKEAKPKRKLKEVVEDQMTQSKQKKEEKKAKEKKVEKKEDQLKKVVQADNPPAGKLQQFMENPFNLIKKMFSKDPELSQLTIDDITKSIIVKDKQDDAL